MLGGRSRFGSEQVADHLDREPDLCEQCLRGERERTGKHFTCWGKGFVDYSVSAVLVEFSLEEDEDGSLVASYDLLSPYDKPGQVWSTPTPIGTSSPEELVASINCDQLLARAVRSARNDGMRIREAYGGYEVERTSSLLLCEGTAYFYREPLSRKFIYFYVIGNHGRSGYIRYGVGEELRTTPVPEPPPTP